MSDAIKKLYDYLAESPSVIYPEDVLAYLSAIEAENAKLRELVSIAVKYCDSGTCDGCPIMGDDESCPYSDMARELGVEVTP